MRLFIWQTLANRKISNTLKLLPFCVLYTKAYLINRTGLVQASCGF